MKYLGATFSVAVGSDAYRDGWDRIFGKRGPEPPTGKVTMRMRDGWECKDVAYYDDSGNCDCDNPATCGCPCHDDDA